MPLRIREQQLENLLADHPDDFFPDRQFRLIGRQTSFAGVGRFDLLFEDHAGRKWLIELKAVPLKITDTDQLMRYHDEIHESAHSSGLVPCFVAPHIPPHVRSYLDGKGIEYREITLAEFQRVATAHGVRLEEDRPVVQQDPSTASDATPLETRELSPSSPSVAGGGAQGDGQMIPSGWDVDRYLRLFDVLGFKSAQLAHKLQHSQLNLTLYFDRSRGRVFFTVYARDFENFKSDLWVTFPAWDKKRSDPRYRLVAPIQGLEEAAFKALLR
jgi:hypothetical protein